MSKKEDKKFEVVGGMGGGMGIQAPYLNGDRKYARILIRQKENNHIPGFIQLQGPDGQKYQINVQTISYINDDGLMICAAGEMDYKVCGCTYEKICELVRDAVNELHEYYFGDENDGK